MKRRATPSMFTLTVTGVSGVVCAADDMLLVRSDGCSEMKKSQPARRVLFLMDAGEDGRRYLIEQEAVKAVVEGDG